MGTHTPGPWAVEKVHATDDGHVHCWIQPAASNGNGWVDGRYMAISGIMAEGDARLIAAAPDLLDALRGLFANGAGTPYANFTTEQHAAHDAIEKATGIAP